MKRLSLVILIIMRRRILLVGQRCYAKRSVTSTELGQNSRLDYNNVRCIYTLFNGDSGKTAGQGRSGGIPVRNEKSIRQKGRNGDFPFRSFRLAASFSLSRCAQSLQNLTHVADMKMYMRLGRAPEQADPAFQSRVFSERRVLEHGNPGLPVELLAR